jgi:hypothetical protein
MSITSQTAADRKKLNHTMQASGTKTYIKCVQVTAAHGRRTWAVASVDSVDIALSLSVHLLERQFYCHKACPPVSIKKNSKSSV